MMIDDRLALDNHPEPRRHHHHHNQPRRQTGIPQPQPAHRRRL